MDSLIRDVRYSIRMLLKSPAFTLVAVISLALGIGANTTIFTIVNAVFLNPLPVQDVSSLMNIYTVDEKNTTANFQLLPVSYRNYEDLRDQNDVFSGMADVSFGQLTLSGEGEPQQIGGLLVTANYFDVLGVMPIRGRTFLPEEGIVPGAPPVAVISYSLWQRQFGGDPNIISKPIDLNAQPYTVVGVTPPGFRGTVLLGDPDMIWIPMGRYDQVSPPLIRQFMLERRALFTFVFGRLKPGVSQEQAETALRTIATRLEQEYPAANEGRNVRLGSMGEAAIAGNPNQQQGFVLAGTLMMGVVGLVLLIACVNLANLLLARAAVREKEMSVRAALGGKRSTLLRQLLTESIVLAIVGGAAGLLVAFWGRDLLWSFRPPQLGENVIDLALDGRVLFFTLGVALLTGILFGLVPALKGSDPKINETLKTGGRRGSGGSGGTRLRGALVVAEVALALVALIGAGLFVRSMRSAQQIDLGFEREKLFSLSFNMNTVGYEPDRAQVFYREALEKAGATPGVGAVTISSAGIFGGGFGRTVIPEGKPQDFVQQGVWATVQSVTPGYFDTLRIPLQWGRAFTEFDREDSLPVAIVNEVMASRYWPGEDALGKRFGFRAPGGAAPEMIEVVGVARNVVAQIGQEPAAVAYLPLRQIYSPNATVIVRSTGEPSTVLATVRAQVQEMEPKLAITNVTTVQELLSQGLWAPRMGAALLSLFGVLALALASVGIYGVLAYNVSQRSHEIGIRLALGAQPGDVFRMIVGQGLRLSAIGVGVGLLFSFGLTRIFSTLLFGISATDPVTFVGIPLILVVVALVACYLPARRATRVDPIVALRYE